MSPWGGSLANHALIPVLCRAVPCLRILTDGGGCRDGMGGTPAHHAAYHGKIETLKWLSTLPGSTEMSVASHQPTHAHVHACTHAPARAH
jgi:hypothetical protein